MRVATANARRVARIFRAVFRCSLPEGEAVGVKSPDDVRTAIDSSVAADFRSAETRGMAVKKGEVRHLSVTGLGAVFGEGGKR